MEYHIQKTWLPTESSEDRMIGEQVVGLRVMFAEKPLFKRTYLYTWPEQCMRMDEVARRYREIASRNSSVDEGGRYYLGKKVDKTAKWKRVETLRSTSVCVWVETCPAGRDRGAETTMYNMYRVKREDRRKMLEENGRIWR